MSKKITFALLLLAQAYISFAQKIEVLPGKEPGLHIATNPGREMLSQKMVNNTAYTGFKNAAVYTMDKGAPQLPVYRTSVQIPDKGGVSLVTEYGSYTDYENINILPSKGSLTRDIDPAKVAYTYGDAYTQDAFYPGTPADIGTPYILRDTRGVTISLYPYTYNPVTKVLRVYHDITVHVTSATGVKGVNEIAVKNKTAPAFNKIYKGHYINYKNNAEPTVQNTGMLIIAPSAYTDALEPLVNWKNQKGIKTDLVSLSETGSTPESIKAYITNYYNTNPGLMYVLLAGDHQDVPSYSYGNFGEEHWSDSYYGQLAGTDLYPEVFTGRFSGSVSDVSLMVARTLEYEKNPMAGTWMKDFAGIGSNEGYGYGDDGEADWQHLRGISTMLKSFGYSQDYEFFESSQGGNDAPDNPEPYMISSAVNNGIGLLNYCGHGGQDVMSTGNYSVSDVDALTNNGKYPFVVSVACNNGTFTNGTSLCEAWLTTRNGSNPTGAIAACGSSILMAWAEPMQTQDAMAEMITNSGVEMVKPVLGDLFYNAQINMLQAYGNSGTAQGVMQTWVFFGDPSVDYRNDVTQQITASHPAEISVSAGEITVQCSTEGAFVSITQNGVIVGTGTVENGVAVISLNEYASTEGLMVTVTAQNHFPYQAPVSVNGALGTGQFSNSQYVLYPNPARDILTVQLNTASDNIEFEVRDVSGKLVYTSGALTGNRHNITTSGYAAGVYFLTITGNNTKTVKKFMVVK